MLPDCYAQTDASECSHLDQACLLESKTCTQHAADRIRPAVQVGFNKDGTIQGLDLDIYNNAGCSLVRALPIGFQAPCHA